MAKLLSLRFWVMASIFLFAAVEALAFYLEPLVAAKWPFLERYLGWFLSTRILAFLAWGLIYLIVANWRLLWGIPWLGSLLAEKLFPVLHGDWEFTLKSNWPIIERLKDSASSTTQVFNLLSENTELPSLLELKFKAKIKQTWFTTRVEFLADDGSALKHSGTLSVELMNQTETEPKRVAWVYRQQNKQGASVPLALSDEAYFLGAAFMHITDSQELEGHYWTNRAWHRGLNAAGTISGKRI